ncbi:MAG: single-stranded DNA-binding protein [Bacteroidia bacterium]|nr:single-stranded DNA-binding protein [Bacteroidia bacterium]
MNALRNKIQLIGNLGKDPKMVEFGNGKTMLNLSLATSESYKDKNGKVATDTQWHRLVVWGKLAVLANKYLQKGSQVAVDGRLTNRSFKDKDGKQRYITEVLVNDILFLGAKRKAA